MSDIYKLILKKHNIYNLLKKLTIMLTILNIMHYNIFNIYSLSFVPIYANFNL